MNKVFVITDERCGGTQLGKIFEELGYRIIDDPQTRIMDREYVLNNIVDIYKEYDYLKICLVSYSIDEYCFILEQVNNIGCKVIFLWRRNYLERALSKCIAEETGVWFKDQINHKYGNYFRLDIARLRYNLYDNKKKIEYFVEYLKNNGIEHYPVMYENIYNLELCAFKRYKQLLKLLIYVNSDFEQVGIDIKRRIIDLLSNENKLNCKHTYQRITNIKKICEEFSCFENGMLKC